MKGKKTYRVVTSFPYKGYDGKGSKGTKNVNVTIGPGEPLPKLSSNEIERLLSEGKICEVDMYGDNVPNERLESLTAEEVKRFFESKNAKDILTVLAGGEFDQDTLGRMLLAAEKLNMSAMVIQTIESKM